MKEILKNMANRLMLDYCKERGIDCSGTYCVKNGRGFTYSLRADTHSRPDVDARWPEIARVTFHKNQVPTFGFTGVK